MSCRKIFVSSKLLNRQYSKALYVCCVKLLKHRRSQCRYSTKDCLATEVSTEKRRSAGKKVTVIGAGSVGLAAAFSILAKNVTEELCLVDVDKNKIAAEKMDLEQGGIYLNDSKVSASSDYKASANSSVCIISAGVRGKADEPRLALMQRNVELLKQIVPNIMKHSPNTIIVVIGNPVDVLTYITWKLSGSAKNRVLGTGTMLDSARFRFFISQRLGIAPSSVHALIIGEHGDSSVPVWSSANVAGMRLAKLNPKIGTEEDEENWNELHKETVQAAYKIIKLKGYTSWAIGLVASAVTKAILQNTNQVLPVSTSACGFHGIEKDVFLSLPCIVNSNGVQAVINQNLTEKEVELLQKSAEILGKAQDSVKI